MAQEKIFQNAQGIFGLDMMANKVADLATDAQLEDSWINASSPSSVSAMAPEPVPMGEMPSPVIVDTPMGFDQVTNRVGNIGNAPVPMVFDQVADRIGNIDQPIQTDTGYLPTPSGEMVLVDPVQANEAIMSGQENLTGQGIGLTPIPELQQQADTQLQQAQDYQALQAGKRAEQSAKQILETGTQEDDLGLMDLVNQAGNMLMGAAKFTADTWSGLSPSTKAALIGTAATAWAKSKGYSNTAGDIARGTLGLYQGMYGMEQQAEENAKDRKASLEVANIKDKQAQAKADAPPKASDVAKIVDQSAPSDKELLAMSQNRQLRDALEPSLGLSWWQSMSDENVLEALNRFKTPYKNYVREVASQGKQPIPFQQFLTQYQE